MNVTTLQKQNVFKNDGNGVNSLSFSVVYYVNLTQGSQFFSLFILFLGAQMCLLGGDMFKSFENAIR